MYLHPSLVGPAKCDGYLYGVDLWNLQVDAYMRTSNTNERAMSYLLLGPRQGRTQVSSDFTTSVEDYLEVIYALLHLKGYARSVDISKYLAVRSSSVTGMLKKLHRMNLVVYEKYRGITLTEKGERLARSVKQRHLVIARFLRILGVRENVANLDAEGIEHHVHPITIERITRFVDFASTNQDWFEAFEQSFTKQAD